MGILYQGTTTTAAIQKGALGAQVALVIPFNSDAEPPSFLSSISNVRLIRVNSGNNNLEYWDGANWVAANASNEENVTTFYVGQPTFPADGATTYTNPNFSGQSLTIDTTVQGALVYGKHYTRSNGVGGSENVYGDTINLISPVVFQTDDTWRFIGGIAITGSNEILQSSYRYTDEVAEELTILINGIPTAFRGSISLADPEPTEDGVYFFSESGTYTNFGNVVVDLSDGLVYGTKVGSTYTATVVPIDIVGYIANDYSGGVGKVGSAIDVRELGKVVGIGGFETDIDPDIEECTTAPTISATRNIVANVPMSNPVREIRIWATSAGDITLGSYIISGGTISRTNPRLITLSVGLNTITDYSPEIGQYLGYNVNTASLMGRVGTLPTPISPFAPYSSYNMGSVATFPSTTALPGGASFGTRYGIQVIYSDGETILDRLEMIEGLAITENSFDFEMSNSPADNVFSGGTIVSDTLINSSGAEQSVAGWKYIRIALDPASNAILFKGIGIRPASTPSGYYRFTNSGGTLIAGEFGGFQADEEVTLEIPETAAFIEIDIKAPTDGDDVYDNAFVTQQKIISEIAGYKLASSGGGEAYDQSLNTTDSVQFQSVAANSFSIEHLAVDLPAWDGTGTAPAGLLVGDAYIMPDGTLKRRMA